MTETAEPLLKRVNALIEERADAYTNLIDKFVEVFEAMHREVLERLTHNRPEFESLFDAEGRYRPDEVARALRAHPQLAQPYQQVFRVLWDIVGDAKADDLERVLRDRFLEELGRPFPVTLRELMALGRSHLYTNLNANWEEVLDLRRSIRRGFRRYRWSKRILVGYAEHPFELDPAEPPLWANDWSEVRLEARPSAERVHVRNFEMPGQFSFVKVYARYSGWATGPAVRQVEKDLRRALRAGFWALSDLTHPAFAHARFGQLPRVTQAGYLERRPFVVRFLSDFLLPRRVKDPTLARRRNCVHLLVQAGHQDHDAVALSLYCSALEALLSRGKEGISKSLAEDVATLLEPSADLRLAAIEVVQEIYNLRSRTLHGDGLDEDPRARAKARALAAHCLSGVLAHAALAAPSDAPPTKRGSDDLLRQLKEARVSGRPLPGTAPSAIRVLWRPDGKLDEGSEERGTTDT